MKIAVCVLSSNPPEILSDIYGDAVFSFSELSHKQYSFKYDENVIKIDPGDPVLCQVRSSYCYGKVIRISQGNAVNNPHKYKSIIAKLNPSFLIENIKSNSFSARLTRAINSGNFVTKLLSAIERYDIDIDSFLKEL